MISMDRQKRIEGIARELCQQSGVAVGDMDQFVSRILPYKINTPHGTVYGGNITTAVPLWTMWIGEAVMVIEMASRRDAPANLL